MADGALGLGRGNKSLPRRKAERQRHAGGDRLAVQQPVGKAAGRFQRVTECVAEIEQSPLAGLALVARHDRGLGAATDRDGMLAGKAPEALPPANTSRQFASSQAKKAASPSRPYLATSA